jgi:glycosyltransferase involved in cell wall biosynthesis
MLKKRFSVIHIVSSLNVGGAERFVIDLGEQQLSQNNHVAILSFGSNDDALVQVAKSKGIQVYTIERVASLIGQFSLFRILKSFDTIHIHTTYALKPLSIVMRFIGRKQCVYTRHGAAENNTPDWQKTHNNFKRHINAMTFVSQESFEIFKRNYPWHDIPMRVVDNGVLLPDESDYSRVDENKINIGSVGRLVPLKHQVSLLRAVAELPETVRNIVQIHLFGDGECEQKLRTYVKSNALDSNVIFYGMVTDRKKIYPSFDLLVVTSETEGLSLVIMEAMAYGKPVIATNVGGNSKLVKLNVNGWIVDYDDHHQLAKLICELNENIEQVATFGQAAREYVKKHFSLESVANKYEEMYQK